MKPTKENFNKLRSLTLIQWNKLNPGTKDDYWTLHMSLPEEKLLGHIESNDVNQELITEELRKYNRESKRKSRDKELKNIKNTEREINNYKKIINWKDDEIEELKDELESIKSKNKKLKEIIANHDEEKKVLNNEIKSLVEDMNDSEVKILGIIQKFGEKVASLHRKLNMMSIS